MHTRIRKIRRMLDLTQEEFGKRIGMKQNTIATIESGRNTSDQTILAICREFNVNENWLRTGEGEPFLPSSNPELDALKARYPGMTAETYVLISKLLNLDPKQQNVIMGFIRSVADDLPELENHDEVDREALHAELDRQLEESSDKKLLAL